MTWKDNIFVSIILTLLGLDVFGWWATLLLWVIPTASTPLLTLSLLSVFAILLFFTIWLVAMIVGTWFLILIIHEGLR